MVPFGAAQDCGPWAHGVTGRLSAEGNSDLVPARVSHSPVPRRDLVPWWISTACGEAASPSGLGVSMDPEW